MESSEKNRHSKALWVTAIATALMFIATGAIFMVYLTQTGIQKDTLKLMQKQTEVLIEESIRDFRPFVSVEVVDKGEPGFSYRIGEPDTAMRTATAKAIWEVSHGSMDWEDRTLVNVGVNNLVFEIENVGNSPLYVTGHNIGGVRRVEWFEQYEKSDEAVCRDALSKETFWQPEIDVLLAPESTKELRADEVIRTMPIETFNTYLDSDSTLSFYTYLYLRYKDLLDHTFDVFWMVTYVFKFKREKNDQGEWIDTPYMVRDPFIEKLQWDVLYHGDSTLSLAIN